MGDPTAKNAGRITLNPLKHLDPIGTLCLIVGGVGWAKPVPIDPRYYQNRKLGMAMSALAGPMSNFLLAVLTMVAMKVIFFNLPVNLPQQPVLAFIFSVLYLMVITNIVLCIFNMMPFPPFDGSRIYLLFLPERLYFRVMKYERVIMIVVLVLLSLGFIDRPLSIAYNAVFRFLDQATGILGRISY